MKTLATCLMALAFLVAGDFGIRTPSAAAQQCDGAGCNGCKSCNKGNCRCGKCKRCRSRSHCPNCNEGCMPQEYCQLECLTEMEERDCFVVDYKTICIPKVVPPWKQKHCCPPRCAETRSVKVLTTRSYECPVCKWEWKVRQPELPLVPEGGPLLDLTSKPVPSIQLPWDNGNTAPDIGSWFQRLSLPGQKAGGQDIPARPAANPGRITHPTPAAAASSATEASNTGSNTGSIGDYFENR